MQTILELLGDTSDSPRSRGRRLDAVDSIGKGVIRELDVWAYGTGPTYDAYWAALESWLASP